MQTVLQQGRMGKKMPPETGLRFQRGFPASSCSICGGAKHSPNHRKSAGYPGAGDILRISVRLVSCGELPVKRGDCACPHELPYAVIFHIKQKILLVILKQKHGLDADYLVVFLLLHLDGGVEGLQVLLENFQGLAGGLRPALPEDTDHSL